MKKLAMAVILLTSLYSPPFLGTSALGALYTDAASFGADIQPTAYTETFNSLTLGEHSPPSIGFTSGGFSYTVSSVNGLWVTDGVHNAPASDRFIGIEASPGTLRIDFTSGNISAVGGYFVDLDSGNVPSGNLTFTLSDGTVQTISNPTASTFTGFIVSAPLSWMVIKDENLTSGEWPNMNNFTVGVAAVPEPSFTGSIAALGLVLLIGVTEIRSRSQRKAA